MVNDQQTLILSPACKSKSHQALCTSTTPLLLSLLPQDKEG